MPQKKTQGAGVVALATLHPMPDLKLAIVGVVDGRESEMSSRLGVSGDKLSRMAALVRAAELKHGKCLFCSEAIPASFRAASKLGWAHLAPILCPCLTDVRQGYREYVANWPQQVAMLAARVEARELDPATPVYANECRDAGRNPNCQGQFLVYAGDIARNIKKWGKHERWTRCAVCRGAHMTNAQQQQPSRNLRRKNNVPLKAPLGEMAKGKGSR